jgi:hypothetical protein
MAAPSAPGTLRSVPSARENARQPGTPRPSVADIDRHALFPVSTPPTAGHHHPRVQPVQRAPDPVRLPELRAPAPDRPASPPAPSPAGTATGSSHVPDAEGDRRHVEAARRGKGAPSRPPPRRSRRAPPPVPSPRRLEHRRAEVRPHHLRTRSAGMPAPGPRPRRAVEHSRPRPVRAVFTVTCRHHRSTPKLRTTLVTSYLVAIDENISRTCSLMARRPGPPARSTPGGESVAPHRVQHRRQTLHQLRRTAPASAPDVHRTAPRPGRECTSTSSPSAPAAAAASDIGYDQLAQPGRM